MKCIGSGVSIWWRVGVVHVLERKCKWKRNDLMGTAYNEEWKHYYYHHRSWQMFKEIMVTEEDFLSSPPPPFPVFCLFVFFPNRINFSNTFRNVWNLRTVLRAERKSNYLSIQKSMRDMSSCIYTTKQQDACSFGSGFVWSRISSRNQYLHRLRAASAEVNWF